MGAFLAGVATGLTLAGIAWLSWYLAPLGDPETGAGRREWRDGAWREPTDDTNGSAGA